MGSAHKASFSEGERASSYLKVNAPERIRVAQDADGIWTCREAVSGSQEYVRADIARHAGAELLAACKALVEKSTDTDGDWSEEWLQALSAITKAEGHQ